LNSATTGAIAHPDSSKQPPGDTLNVKLINNLALKGEINIALRILDSIKLYRQEDLQYKKKFEQRFKYKKDRSNSLAGVPKSLHKLVNVYQQYWRMCLLDNSKINDSLFRSKALAFYIKENEKSNFTSEPFAIANLEKIANHYIAAKGYHANDFGRTGFLYDLIVWKDVKPVTYTVRLIEDSVSVKVNFIDKFISLGWLAYARLGRGPGGWATDKELFCVTDLYPDLSSEKFLISYLKHEAQHFLDLKNFPGLPSKDLEYRSKLIELCFSNKQLFELLTFFKEGGKDDSTNAHPFANYCIIRNLSTILFNSAFENDVARWRSVTIETIQAAARELYLKSNQEIKAGIYLK